MFSMGLYGSSEKRKILPLARLAACAARNAVDSKADQQTGLQHPYSRFDISPLATLVQQHRSSLYFIVLKRHTGHAVSGIATGEDVSMPSDPEVRNRIKNMVTRQDENNIIFPQPKSVETDSQPFRPLEKLPWRKRPRVGFFGIDPDWLVRRRTIKQKRPSQNIRR